MTRRLPDPNARALYERLISPLRAAARLHGYALAVHGSLARDIDLIAVPWVPYPSNAIDLVRALRVTCEDITGRLAYVKQSPTADPCDFTLRSPEPKFHGRLAYSLYVAAGRGGYSVYLDLSVLPTQTDTIERRGLILDQLQRMDPARLADFEATMVNEVIPAIERTMLERAALAAAWKTGW